MAHIVGIAHDKWQSIIRGVVASDHRFHSMSRDVHEQWRERASLTDTGIAWQVGTSIHHACFEPRGNSLSERGIGCELLKQCCLIDGIEGRLDIRVEDKTGPLFERAQNGPNGILRAALGTKAVAVQFEFRLPFRFEGQLHQRLLTTVNHWQNGERTPFYRARFRNPHASRWPGRLLAPIGRMDGFRHHQAFSGREGLDAIDARGVLAVILLSGPANRQQPGRFRCDQLLLQHVNRSPVSALTGAIDICLDGEHVLFQYAPLNAAPGLVHRPGYLVRTRERFLLLHLIYLTHFHQSAGYVYLLRSSPLS